jgi:hypothetical protein
VVIATGPFQVLRGPTAAQRLDRGIAPFHRTNYRRPDQVPRPGGRSRPVPSRQPPPPELRRWAERLGVIEPGPALAQVRIDARRHLLAAFGVHHMGTDEIREKCDALAHEVKHLQPIKVATFEVSDD